MREILFRAKTTKKNNPNYEFNEKWVEGDLIRSGGKCYIHPTGNKVSIEGELGKIIIMHEIAPETLCQYTGLTDKNGKKIWENDIVLLREEIQDYEWKAVVKFGNPNGEYNWGWQLVPIGECDMNKDILLWIDMEIANCEVIGNIFDNEDLLEV